MLKLFRPPPTGRITQLEGPQKVVGLLEIGSHCEYFMNQILHTLDTIFTQGIGNERIVCERDSGTINFPVATFVDEVADRFEVGFAVCDVGLDDLQHFLGCLGEFDEDPIVDLKETEELQYFSGFGGNFIDTARKPLALSKRNNQSSSTP
jgi:hypothetical protein